jgi:TRAP-type C4-dicarboxylate transport system permease small subunit
VVVLGIVARYILLISIPWTEEVARYLMIWTAFIAFGVAYRRRELILVRSPDRQDTVRRFTITPLWSAICFADSFLVLMVIYGIKLCMANSHPGLPRRQDSHVNGLFAIIPHWLWIVPVFIGESMIDFFKKFKGADQ